MGKIIDIVTNPETAQLPFGLSLTKFFAAFGSVLFFGAIANIGRVAIMRTTSERIVTRLREKLFNEIITKDIKFFDKQMSGDLISRLNVDASMTGKSLTSNLTDGLRYKVLVNCFRSLILSSVGLSMMFYTSAKLTVNFTH